VGLAHLVTVFHSVLTQMLLRTGSNTECRDFHPILDSFDMYCPLSMCMTRRLPLATLTELGAVGNKAMRGGIVALRVC